jgi:hypothetical protein
MKLFKNNNHPQWGKFFGKGESIKTVPVYSPYHSFRSPGEVYKSSMLEKGFIQKTFDEPTYLTFSLSFNTDNISLSNTNFDRMPMPLFNSYDEENYEAREEYSAIQYLRDNNEVVRADLLENWIYDWLLLQSSYQYYFQSISGLDSLITVNPLRGSRASLTESKITFTMLEGLDQRVTHLLNTYRKIAWDDVYQRWILPDMMRFFKLSVYVNEFRSFHRSNHNIDIRNESAEELTIKEEKKLARKERRQDRRDFRRGIDGGEPMILSLIENFTPMYVLDLEMCDFDITSFRSAPDTMTIGNAEMREISFDINVRNYKERYINPMLDYFWNDFVINGLDRSNSNLGPNYLSVSGDNNSVNPRMYPSEISIRKLEGGQGSEHESGKPYVNDGNINNLNNANPNYSTDLNSVDPISPNTWLGNTATFGKAFATNLVEDEVNKFKTQKIPGLGISFNEGLAAIQSKNVFTLLGAARGAIDNAVKNTLPSQELESNFVDTQFRDFLEGVLDSEATSEEGIELQNAANQILNDEGAWEQIKDLSQATDLISTALGEINNLAEIENRNSLKKYYESQNVTPIEVKDNIAIEGLPSSTSTTREIEGKGLVTADLGVATNGDNIEGNQNTTDLGSTDGELSPGETIPPSSELGDSAGDSISQADDGLGSEATGGLQTGLPSEELGSKASGGISQPDNGLGNEAEGGLNTNNPSEQLGSQADGGISQPNSELGENAIGGINQPLPSSELGNKPEESNIIVPEAGSELGEDKIESLSLRGDPRRLRDKTEGERLNIPRAGEATDGDDLEGSQLNIPEAGQAERNKIQE